MCSSVDLGCTNTNWCHPPTINVSRGRLNGKPIRIAANSCPFDQTEAHFVEAALYDDLASTGEPSIVRPCGTPLPAWEDIKDDPEIDLRELLERKKKRKEREVEHGSPPQCVRVQAPQWTHCLSLMKTENSGKVVVDQLQSTAMSSEEVTVDHAQSTVMNPQEVVVDQTKSTAMSSEEAMSLSAKERKCLIDLLHEYKDVFAWDYDEMPGIDPGLVAHSLNVEPGTRPVVQPMRTFHTEVEAQITQEPAGHAMFSFMDGFSGYNQIRMSTKDAEKTAFCTPIGNFYYTVMPFGLKNAGATYQRTMTAMFHDMMHKEIEDYVDDIVMNPLKCAFGVSAGKFLGFLVHNRGIDVDPAKASAIATMKAPTSHKELKSFLGRLSYIRRFIPGLAAVTAVFTPLMKKGIITETPTAIKSQAIVDLLAQFPGEDSSSISHEVPGGMGEALLADLVDSTWTLKFDGSSTSNSKYKAYITGLTITYEMGIKHLRVIGDSNLIICQTKGVADLKVLKDYVLIAGDLYRRLPRGVLARCVNLQEAAKKLIEVHEKCCEFRDGVNLYRRLQRLGYFWPSMSKEAATLQEQCSFCQHQHESDQIYATFISSDWRTPFLEYLIENILPQTSQAAIRLKKLSTRYFVEGRHIIPKGNMATPWPFHTWGLDLIGPINPSSGGYIWILVATEYFSKWVEAIPLRKATGAAVANFIREHIITRFGIPHKIISDNGKGWSSHLADTLWAYRGSTKTTTSFTPFSLVYSTDAISPMELLVPSPRVLHGMDLEANADICAEARVADLESLEEARELAQVRSLRYHQKLVDAYEKTLQTRIFAKGQMLLRTVDHVRRGLPSPSKFSPNWEGPYLIREAYDSGYYKLSTADGTTLVDPINGKWLKRYYS
uniref:Integrase catalytic domain-containing protein n=1 Tax=Fagus sylvatica TaxID=28930 RepID=A0A2N9ENH5_FAGSY